jgi:diacylglycerol kinase (ATP)
MSKTQDGFVKGRLKSLRYAFRGMLMLVRSEHSIMVQLAIGVLVSIFGFLLDITTTEWMLQTICIGMVLAAEGLNTAVEKLCDFVNPGPDPKIGRIKDIAAGGVGFAAVIAFVVGLIIYAPKLANLF